MHKKNPPVENLTPEELANLRSRVQRSSAAKVAAELRLAKATIYKMMSGEPVHRLTVAMFRSHVATVPVVEL